MNTLRDLKILFSLESDVALQQYIFAFIILQT